MDFFSVCCYVVRGMNQDVDHVNGEPVLSKFLGKYCVHHRLECGWGVCESKEHDSQLEQSLICDKGCFPFVSFDANIVVSPSDVEF